MLALATLLLLVSFLCLLVGLVKPKLFAKLLGSNVSRKRVVVVFTISTFFFIGLAGKYAPPPSPNAVATPSPLPIPVETTSAPAVAPSPTANENTNGQQGQAQDGYEVTDVADGDTFDVLIEGKKKTVRIIGMDTPETKDPRKPVQCFGKEASAKAVELLKGRTVYLEADASQDNLDKYGRMLRSVFFDDLGGKRLDYALWMISEGYAFEYTYQTPYKYQTEYKNAQKQAQEGWKGLWSPDTCNGEHRALNTPVPAQPIQTPTPIIKPAPLPTESKPKTPVPFQPTPQATKEPVATPTPQFSCGAKRTCGQMSSCAEAKYQLNTCGNKSLDSDDDGVPCETGVCK